MRTAALIIWCLTAAVGGYLLAVLISRGGLRQQATRITVFPAALTFSHPLLAVAGLACWVGYLVTGRVGLAWLAFLLLCVTALLGFIMLTRWLVGRGGRHARRAENSFPLRATLLHGVAALGTFTLVMIVAEMASHH